MISAQQGHPEVLPTSAQQCLPLVPISAQQCHPAVPPSVPPINAAHQCCSSVPLISDQQCRLSVQHHQ
ncbi:unnamed protein product, partial [Staurois parvus]